MSIHPAWRRRTSFVGKPKAGGKVGRRLFEILEGRALLAADATAYFQNAATPMDVNADGYVAPLDALMVINQLNAFGSGPLNFVRDVSKSTVVTKSTTNFFNQTLADGSDPAATGFVDVSGDGFLSPIDALLVINRLNNPPLVQFRLETADLSGAPITSVVAGTDFELEAFVQDIGAAPNNAGVSAAYMTANYNSTQAHIDAATNVVFGTGGSPYTNSTFSDLSTPGKVNETGAIAGLTPTGTGEFFLWSVVVHADQAGTLTFTGTPATASPQHDVRLYSPAPILKVPANQITFVDKSITVIQPVIPNITINSVTVNEGTVGTSTPATFTVTLSQPTTVPVTVGFATANGTALTSDNDYSPQTGQLTFAPGETSKQISVPVNGDNDSEGDETFVLNLSSSVNGVITVSQGVGTIHDSSQNGLSINDATVIQSGTSPVTAQFTVTLATSNTVPVTVNFATANQTATAGVDYVAQSGVLTFAPGVTAQTISVSVDPNALAHPSLTFLVNLTGATGAAITDAQGVGTILPVGTTSAAQARIQLKVVDAARNPVTQLNVGDAFFVQAYVTDLRSSPPSPGVFAAYLDVFYNSGIAAANGAITYGTDYKNLHRGDESTLGVIDEVGAAGDLMSLTTAPDLLFEAPFKATSAGLALFHADPADISPRDDVLLYGNSAATPTALVDYVDANVQIGSNAFVVGDVATIEGNSGVTVLTFTVTRFFPDNTTATVNYNTADGTATLADNDYQAASGTLTFGPGQNTRTVSVNVVGDTKFEGDETFNVVLSGAVNASIGGSGIGKGTILNDDAAPTVSIANASANEGQKAGFVVTLSAVSGAQTTVVYNTADLVTANAATAGADYTAASGTLTFAPGVTSQTISVQALNDILTEPTETFQVALSSPTNATLGIATATGSIFDVAPSGIAGFVYVDANNNGIKENAEFGLAGVTITLTSPSNATFVTRTAVTVADGSYAFGVVPPGTYNITETQPGFYVDGIDTPGSPSPVAVANDQFIGVTVGSSQLAAGFNFGEQGLRADFAALFITRPPFLASSILSGVSINGPSTNLTALNLTHGDVWVSFDGGFQGLKTIDALFSSAKGTVTLTLYDTNLRPLAVSATQPNKAEIQYTGVLGSPYFLKISGTNTSVNITVT